jgi:anti-anti-sigma regulatory factor
MNQKFRAVVHNRDDVAYVKLSGVIDEDNELAELTERIGQGTTVIDLGEIERINSCGVRDWVNWLGKIEKGGAKPVLVECSPAIVAQINLVNNFTGNGVVKSFFAPYFCPSCDLEKVLLVETQEMLSQDRPKAPTCRCDECDGVMDFDDMEESYFAFVGQMKNKIIVSPKVDAVMAEFTPGDGERKVRSRPGSSAGSPPGGGSSSLPSVPSLPQMSRGSPQPVGAAGSGPVAGSGGGSGARSFSGGGSAGSFTGSAGGGSNPGSLPVSVANPVGYGAPMAVGSKSRLYGAVVVVLLVVAIGLLTYAVFFAGKHSAGSRPSQPALRYAQGPSGTRDTAVAAASGYSINPFL